MKQATPLVLSTGRGTTNMKKFLTGVVCGAAIAAATAVILPLAAVRVAARLSKPGDKAPVRAGRASPAPAFAARDDTALPVRRRP